MNLEAGKHRYDFPGDYLRAAAVWDKDPALNLDAICYPLTHLSPADMMKLHKEMHDGGKEFVAMPVYISVIHRELWLYPIPDRDCIAQIKYETVHIL